MKLVGFALAVALAGQTSILVFLFSGHPWQVEMHFYYFAVLAMLSGFCDWPVLVAAAGLIAVHHLSLNFVLPDAVYPGGSNFLRVVVHAVVVVIETAMLIGIGYAIRARSPRLTPRAMRPRRPPTRSSSPAWRRRGNWLRRHCAPTG